jgi:hypothetical protein
MTLKRISETTSCGDSRTDTAHLPPETKVEIVGPEFVRVHENDGAESQTEGDQDHPWKRGAHLRPPTAET